jgi:hypothetical protein
MRDFLKDVCEQRKSKYHELTAYLTALTCALMFITHSEFRQIYFELLKGADADRAIPGIMFLTLIVSLGFFISLGEVFMKRKKRELEKITMGAFFLGANALAGIAAGIEMLPSRWSWAVIIPILNIIMGIILVYQIGLQKFDISDENASLRDLMIASLSLLIVFAITNYVLNLTWTATFSICMLYSSTVLFIVSWTMYSFRVFRLSKT